MIYKRDIVTSRPSVPTFVTLHRFYTALCIITYFGTLQFFDAKRQSFYVNCALSLQLLRASVFLLGSTRTFCVLNYYLIFDILLRVSATKLLQNGEIQEQHVKTQVEQYFSINSTMFIYSAFWYIEAKQNWSYSLSGTFPKSPGLIKSLLEMKNSSVKAA